MFHNSNEAALLQPGGGCTGMEGVVAPESSSLMIPVVGPSGEIMYYLPAANGRINGAMAIGAGGHQLPAAPLRLDHQLQMPSFLQQHQAQPNHETLLMRSISNGLMPVCGSATSSYASALEHSAPQNYLPGGFAAIGGQQQVAIPGKSMIMKQNLEIREFTTQLGAKQEMKSQAKPVAHGKS